MRMSISSSREPFRGTAVTFTPYSMDTLPSNAFALYRTT